MPAAVPDANPPNPSASSHSSASRSPHRSAMNWRGRRLVHRFSTPRLRATLARDVLDEPNHQSGPSGLMTRAEAAAGVAVEVLVEEHMVAPIRVACPTRIIAVYRASP